MVSDWQTSYSYCCEMTDESSQLASCYQNDLEVWQKMRPEDQVFEMERIPCGDDVFPKHTHASWRCDWQQCYATLSKQRLLIVTALSHLITLTCLAESPTPRHSFFMVTSTKATRCVAKYGWKCDAPDDLLLKLAFLFVHFQYFLWNVTNPITKTGFKIIICFLYFKILARR